jgi:hypothetical protein
MVQGAFLAVEGADAADAWGDHQTVVTSFSGW